MQFLAYGSLQFPLETRETSIERIHRIFLDDYPFLCAGRMFLSCFSCVQRFNMLLMYYIQFSILLFIGVLPVLVKGQR